MLALAITSVLVLLRARVETIPPLEKSTSAAATVKMDACFAPEMVRKVVRAT